METKQFDEIYAFGNPDRSDEGFKDRASIVSYIESGIFLEEHGRYRQTAKRSADIIVLSRDGWAYGHFHIRDRVEPTPHDVERFSKVKHVYIVSESVKYAKRVRLYEFGIKVNQVGVKLTAEQFEQVLAAAEGCNVFSSAIGLPGNQPNTAELERILVSVRSRLRQSAFRLSMIETFGACVVTGCAVPEALEAAHINPWFISQSHDVGNGLLLRSDIHALFDQDLVTLHPQTLQVRVATKLLQTGYGEFDGKEIHASDSAKSQIDRGALEVRWAQFSKKTAPE